MSLICLRFVVEQYYDPDPSDVHRIVQKIKYIVCPSRKFSFTRRVRSSCISHFSIFFHIYPPTHPPIMWRHYWIFLSALTEASRQCSRTEQTAFTDFLTTQYHATSCPEDIPEFADLVSIFEMKSSAPAIHSKVCLRPECTKVFHQISLAPADCPDKGKMETHDRAYILPNCSMSSPSSLPYHLNSNRTMLRTIADDVLLLCASYHQNHSISIPRVPIERSLASTAMPWPSALSLTLLAVVSIQLL